MIKMHQDKNGGVLGINFMLKIIHKALFGKDMNPFREHKLIGGECNYEYG